MNTLKTFRLGAAATPKDPFLRHCPVCKGFYTCKADAWLRNLFQTFNTARDREIEYLRRQVIELNMLVVRPMQTGVVKP